AVLGVAAIQFDIDRVDCVATALDALSAKHYNIAILDLDLPDSMGLATVEAVCAAHTEVAIVVLLPTDDDKLATEALISGAHGFIPKSQISVTKLFGSMRSAVSQHRQLVGPPKKASKLTVKRLCVEVRRDIAKINCAIAQLETCNLDARGRDAVSNIRSQLTRLSARLTKSSELYSTTKPS
ncbi:MAG: response regulator, partial [Planctomycetia bacterium]|nr:response regulator [Planctomycetia bacterium]